MRENVSYLFEELFLSLTFIIRLPRRDETWNAYLESTPPPSHESVSIAVTHVWREMQNLFEWNIWLLLKKQLHD
jgi:hypothetical protein